MTTAYTSLLGLALPVTGELSGTWGDTVNNSITALLDSAVAGTTNLSTDADVTLTTTTGAANTAREAILLCSGARTAQRTVTAPAQSKTYTIINATTGGFAVKLVGVGPTTGVTILAGESAFCAWNGSDFVKVSNFGGAFTVTDLTVTGNTILGDASTDTATINASSRFNALATFGYSGISGSTLTTAAPAFVYSGATTYTDTNVSGGTKTHGAFWSLATPTLANATTATTYTNASTLYISGAPTAGTNITITNPYSVYVAAGAAYYGGGISTTQLDITGQGTLRLQDTTGGEYVGLRSPSALGASYTLTFPADDGTSGQALITDGSGVLSWSTAASGDVYGPGSSTDNAVARFDSTTGKLLQNSVVLIGDTGAVTGVTDLSASGSVTLSGGTANGVTYLNGSKVLTSGSALTFNGTDLSTTGKVYAQQFNGDGTNDLSFLSNNASKPIVFYTGVGGVSATEAMRLTSSSLTTASTILTGLGTSTLGGEGRLTVEYDTTVGFSGTGYRLASFRSTTSANADQPGIVLGYDTAGAGIVAARTNGTGQPLAFWTYNGSAWGERARITANGNMGLGVTPSAWGSGLRALQVGNSTAIWQDGTGAGSVGYVSHNVYSDGTNEKYLFADEAEKYLQAAGSHAWYIAPTGTAGNNISFTQAMTLDASGRLGLGTTSPVEKLSLTDASSLGIRMDSPDNILRFTESGTTKGYIRFIGGATNRMDILNNGEGIYINTSGNVGIGTSSPTTKLDINQAAVGSAALRIYGTSSPGLNIVETSGSVTTQLVNDAAGAYFGTTTAHPLVFRTSGTERARIDSSGNFTVNSGSQYVQLAPTGNITGVHASGSGGETLLSAITGVSNGYQISVTTGNAQTYKWHNGGTQSMTLNSSAELLVGGTTSYGKLTVRGYKAITTFGNVSFSTSDDATSTFYVAHPAGSVILSSDNALAFGAGSGAASAERARITTAGEFLVNDTATGYSAKLYVNGSIAARNGGVDGTFADAFVAGYTSNYNERNIIQTSVSSSGVGSGFRFLTSNGAGLSTTKTTLDVTRDRIVFYNDGTEKMRLDSGNLLVGTTSSPGAAGPRLYVDNTNNTSGDSGIFSLLGANCSNTSSAAFSALITGVGNKFYVYGNGNVVNTNNSYGAISDVKFKENIVDATPKLNDVLNLKVRNFNLKTEPNNKQIGFIAQEFEEVFPAMIDVSPDTDVTGKTLETTHKSIKLSVLVPILVKAIQEQQAIIESLKARLDAANL